MSEIKSSLPVVSCILPGLLSVGGERRSLICASLSPSTHWTSRVRRRGQLEVQRAETAAQEQPDSFNTRRPESYSHIVVFFNPPSLMHDKATNYENELLSKYLVIY